jgi:kynureninase
MNHPTEMSGFSIPDGVVYLDGNSLGALPAGVAERLADVVRREWGQGLIRSWNDARWMELSERVAARIAPLVGADAADIHLGDSTSVSLFKTMVTAARLRPDRRVLVLEPSTFPTDGYVAAGVADLMGLELRWCDPADPVAAVDDDVALLSLTHVDFRTGAMFEMDSITRAAQERGALVQWDLCHSTGAVPVDLTSSGADLAVGCTYKYLNGGPGSPSFLWVAPHHQDAARQPITGWIGHASPFSMSLYYEPAAGIASFASGTPPVLALSALEAALEAFEGVSLPELRARSLELTDAFIEGVDSRLPGVFEIVTPREHARRGSQVSLRHPAAYGVVQALIAREVIGDFRDPDIARFGFAPLYNTLEDVTTALDRLELVMDEQEFADPAYGMRNAVT